MEGENGTGSRVRPLERELHDREQRIAELEAALEAARELSAMTAEFSRSLVEHATGRRSRADETAWPPDAEGVTDDDAGAAARAATVDGGTEQGETGDGGIRSAATVSETTRDDRQADDRTDVEWGGLFDPPERDPETEPTADAVSVTDAVSNDRRTIVAELRSTIQSLDPVTRGMLAYYHEYGPTSPLDAYVVAGGDGGRLERTATGGDGGERTDGPRPSLNERSEFDGGRLERTATGGGRTAVYRRNGLLREADLLEHVGRGRYVARLREIVEEAHGGRLDAEDVRATVAAVEEAIPPARPPETVADWPDP